MKFTNADEDKRVRLLPNEEEGWAEEFGYIMGVDEDSETIVVEIDDQYREEDDDGIREVSFDDAELIEE